MNPMKKNTSSSSMNTDKSAYARKGTTTSSPVADKSAYVRKDVGLTPSNLPFKRTPDTSMQPDHRMTPQKSDVMNGAD